MCYGCFERCLLQGFRGMPPENPGANDDFRFKFNAVGSFGKAGNIPSALLISPRSAEHAFGSLPSIWYVSDFFSVPYFHKLFHVASERIFQRRETLRVLRDALPA